jgi:hypothetical protein
MAFAHTKKVDIGSFRPGSGSDQKGLDPSGSGSATLTHPDPQHKYYLLIVCGLARPVVLN